MDNRENYIPWAIKVAFAFLAAWWLQVPDAVRLMLVLIAADVITGVWAAIISKDLSSDVSFVGLSKKLLVIFVVSLTIYLESYTVQGLTTIVAGFYAAHEGLSILENLNRAGIPVPPTLADILRKPTTKS